VQDGNIPDLLSTTSAQSSAITSLQNDLAGKAPASALNALTTRVTTAEGNITANAGAVTALSADVGKFAAAGKFRISVEATPSGATSRIGLSATASGGASTQTAALFLEATSSGVGRVLIDADRFAILNGTTRDVPFVVDGGATYIRKAMIKSGDIDADKIDTASFSTAGMALFGGTLQSDNYAPGAAGWRIRRNGVAEFWGLIVRGSIQDGAVSDRAVTARPGDWTNDTTGSWSVVNTVTLTGLSPDAIYFANIKLETRNQLTGDGNTRYRVERDLRDGGTWLGYETLGGTDQSTTDWLVRIHSDSINGDFDGVRYRVSILTGSVSSPILRRLRMTITGVTR